MQTPRHLQKLAHLFKRLPGVGARSAERLAYHLVDWSASDLNAFAELVKDVPLKLSTCHECGSLIEEECTLCNDPSRDPGALCVVATFKDLLAIECTGEFKGRYHVLGTLLSPLDQNGPEKISLPRLKQRLIKLGTTELLLALDSTLEGDATSLWIKQELSLLPLKISRLAFGLPMGSALDYVDGGTLARALSSRREY